MEFIPIEILESIIYLLNHADLNNLIQTYSISSINWSIIHLYRFGTYKSNLSNMFELDYLNQHGLISI